MPGCRPLTHAECNILLADGFDPDARETPARRFYVRMMLATGLRVSELLTLRFKQLVRFNRTGELLGGAITPLGYIEIARRNLKGGKHEKSTVQNRRVVLGEPACQAIVDYIRGLLSLAAANKKTTTTDAITADGWVFPSRRGGHLAPRTLVDALAAAFRRANLAYTADRTLSNHSFRKTYAKAAYEASGKDLIVTQQCLGHVRVDSTVAYLDAHRDEIDRVQSEVSGMNFENDPCDAEYMEIVFEDADENADAVADENADEELEPHHS